MPTTLVRLLLVGLIAVGTVWLGQTFGPRHVEADVYRVLRISVGAIADVLQGEPHPAGPRLVFINGQRLQTNLTQVPRPPRDVLDMLEAHAQLQAVTAHTAQESHRSQDNHINRQLAAALRRPFRLDGPSWGAYGKLASEISVAEQDLLSTIGMHRQAEGSRPAFAGGFLVLALEREPGRASDVWTLHFDTTFNPLGLVGLAGGDAPGIDLPGMARYPGSRRLFSLAELSQAAEAHVLVYEGGGSVGDHLQYYEALFQQLGLRALRGVAAAEREPGRAVRAYSGKGQEITLFITAEATRPGRVLDVIEARLPARDG